MPLHNQSLIPLVLAAAIIASKSFACASCPCGGDKPMILSPAEEWKLYVGAARASHFRNIRADGDEMRETGPDVKYTLTTTIGRSISNSAFISATIPIIRNVKDDEAKSGLGDPSIGGRYTLVFPSFAEPWIPQVQLLASYKHARSTSVYDSQDQDRMDVFGAGLSEYDVGVDVWLGMYDGKVGVAHSYAFPIAKSIEGVKIQAGGITRTTLTLGYGFEPYGTLLAGVNREAKRELRTDDVEIGDSDQLSHSPFVTYEAKVSIVDTLRLTWAKQAESHFANKNVTRSTSATLAYLRSF